MITKEKRQPYIELALFEREVISSGGDLLAFGELLFQVGDLGVELLGAHALRPVEHHGCESVVGVNAVPTVVFTAFLLGDFGGGETRGDQRLVLVAADTLLASHVPVKVPLTEFPRAKLPELVADVVSVCVDVEPVHRIFRHEVLDRLSLLRPKVKELFLLLMGDFFHNSILSCIWV